jgi:hypothetical protein
MFTGDGFGFGALSGSISGIMFYLGCVCINSVSTVFIL